VATRNNCKRPSPETRVENAARRVRVKKCLEKAQQEEAFRELLSIMGANGGKIPYGAVDQLVKTYHQNGYKAVTRDNLNYRLKKNKRSSGSDSLIGSSVAIGSHTSSVGIISDLTTNQSAPLIDTSNRVSEQINEVLPADTSERNVGGRAKGWRKCHAKEN
jgi:hypothetical protein